MEAVDRMSGTELRDHLLAIDPLDHLWVARVNQVLLLCAASGFAPILCVAQRCCCGCCSTAQAFCAGDRLTAAPADAAATGFSVLMPLLPLILLAGCLRLHVCSPMLQLQLPSLF